MNEEVFTVYSYETRKVVRNGIKIYEKLKDKDLKFPDSTFLFSDSDKVVFSTLIASFLNINIKEAFEDADIYLEDLLQFTNFGDLFTNFYEDKNPDEKTIKLFENLLEEIRKNDSSLEDKKDLHIESIVESLFYPIKCSSNIVEVFFKDIGFYKKPFLHPSYDNIAELVYKRKNNEEEMLYDDYYDETFKNSIHAELSEYGIFQDEKIYISNPAVGREEELKKLMISLLTPNTSSLIVGEAGVGKTALVDGLVYLIKLGKVPNMLKDKRILKLDVSYLLAGTKYRGDFEEKISTIIDLLREVDDVILYIDEFHSVMGAGSTADRDLDLADMLKPYLNSGEIKMIGATTKEEYEKIKEDKAFNRRFNKIEIKEPNEEILYFIIKEEIKKLEMETDVNFEFNNTETSNIINNLIETTNKRYRKYNEKENNPALVLRILRRAFAYALYEDSPMIKKEYLKEALLDEESLYKSSKERFSKNIFKEEQENKVIDFQRYKKNV